MVRCAEEELCGVCDLFSNGKLDKEWLGRGGQLQIVERYAVLRRAVGAMGHMRQAHYSAMWARSRIQELLSLVRRDQEQGGLELQHSYQWDCIVRKLCSPNSPMLVLTKGRTI